jgi:hypothetical protein
MANDEMPAGLKTCMTFFYNRLKANWFRKNNLPGFLNLAGLSEGRNMWS